MRPPEKTSLISIDTNVLVRSVVREGSDPDQCAAAEALIASARSARVAAVVFVETIWIFHRPLRFPRDEIARLGQRILDEPQYEVIDADELQEALDLYATTNVGFIDAAAR